jgi:hypothetical protein
MTARQDYQELMEKRLNDWKAKTEQFKVGAGQMEAEAKAQYGKALALLHAKQEEAWQHFEKMKAASESNWQQFQTNMDKAGADLKAAAEHMTEQFRK